MLADLATRGHWFGAVCIWPHRWTDQAETFVMRLGDVAGRRIVGNALRLDPPRMRWPQALVERTFGDDLRQLSGMRGIAWGRRSEQLRTTAFYRRGSASAKALVRN